MTIASRLAGAAAVCVAALVFRYDPISYRLGVAISAISVLAVLWLLANSRG